MNPKELDLRLEWLPKAEFEDFLLAVRTDRRLKIELYLAGSLAVVFPAALGFCSFPLVRDLGAGLRLAVLAVPIGVLWACLRVLPRVSDWCHRRAEFRVARARGLLR